MLAATKWVSHQGRSGAVKFRANGDVQDPRVYVYEVKNGAFAYDGIVSDLVAK